MNVIKLNFLKIRTDSQLKNNKASRKNVPYRDAHQVGIIFTVEDKSKHDTVKELIKKLEADGKQVQVIEYLPEDKQNYEFRFNFFTQKDLSFFGKINAHEAKKFADTIFDFVFYLDSTPNPLIMYLLASSKAKCRVGPSWEDGHPYFELMIESKPDYKIMAETMFQYTTQLK